MTPPVLHEQPLLGCTVAVTADRRRADLAALLRRRGARVIEAPTLKLVPLEDDAELRAATRACVDDPPDYVVATTGRGWRGWISAAEGECRSTASEPGKSGVDRIHASSNAPPWNAPMHTKM